MPLPGVIGVKRGHHGLRVCHPPQRRPWRQIDPETHWICKCGREWVYDPGYGWPLLGHTYVHNWIPGRIGWKDQFGKVVTA